MIDNIPTLQIQLTIFSIYTCKDEIKMAKAKNMYIQLNFHNVHQKFIFIVIITPIIIPNIIITKNKRQAFGPHLYAKAHSFFLSFSSTLWRFSSHGETLMWRVKTSKNLCSLFSTKYILKYYVVEEPFKIKTYFSSFFLFRLRATLGICHLSYFPTGLCYDEGLLLKDPFSFISSPFFVSCVVPTMSISQRERETTEKPSQSFYSP